MFNNYTLVAVSRSGVAVVRGYEKNNADFAREVRECVEVSNHLLVLVGDKIKYEYKRGDDLRSIATVVKWREFLNDKIKCAEGRELTARERLAIERVIYKVM